jgi:hypothetical protein
MFEVYKKIQQPTIEEKQDGEEFGECMNPQSNILAPPCLTAPYYFEYSM